MVTLCTVQSYAGRNRILSSTQKQHKYCILFHYFTKRQQAHDLQLLSDARDQKIFLQDCKCTGQLQFLGSLILVQIIPLPWKCVKILCIFRRATPHNIQYTFLKFILPWFLIQCVAFLECLHLSQARKTESQHHTAAAGKISDVQKMLETKNLRRLEMGSFTSRNKSENSYRNRSLKIEKLHTISFVKMGSFCLVEYM